MVGTVIGSGVFFKAEAVLTKTGGNLSVGILAFISSGVVMIISACTFGAVSYTHLDVDKRQADVWELLKVQQRNEL